MAGEIDRAIDDGETIVRGVCTPYHYDAKKKKLKKGAFKPKTPASGISVYRSAILDPHECKTKSATLTGDGKLYVGLAAFLAEAVRTAGAVVQDSREQYYGHADVFICHDLAEALTGHVPGDPLPPRVQEAMDERIDRLLKAATFHCDPAPSDEGWTGPNPLL